MEYENEYDGYMKINIHHNFLRVFFKYQDILTTLPCLVPEHTSERRFIRLIGSFLVIDEDGDRFTRENNSYIWDILVTRVIPEFEAKKLGLVLCEECLQEIAFLKSKEIILDSEGEIK